MCSFVITPSILFYMLLTISGKCEQSGGNKSSIIWSLDSGWCRPTRWTVLQNKRQGYSLKCWRMNGEERSFKGVWVWICVRARACVRVCVCVYLRVRSKTRVKKCVGEVKSCTNEELYWQARTEREVDGEGKEIREPQQTASQTK